MRQNACFVEYHKLYGDMYFPIFNESAFTGALTETRYLKPGYYC